MIQQRSWIITLIVVTFLCHSSYSFDPKYATPRGGAGDASVDDMCTTLAVSPGAAADRSVMTTHTNDCAQCDFRVALVPARDHEEGAQRPVYAFRLEYPRYVGFSRGPDYHPEKVDTRFFDWKESVAIGHVPQVKHTYQYYDAIYGVMNEKQLAIGESTCSGAFVAKPAHAGGKALLDVAELTRIAMERASTAREAIAIMGAHAEKFGYYQCDWTDDDHTMKMVGGEALSVADTKEAWIFHVLPDDTGSSAIWVAQRVPDGHIAVVANDFVIKEVDLEDTENFMGSTNIRDIAIRNGLWHPSSDEEKPNFQKLFSVPRTHPEYVSRRLWRVFDLVAPSLNLSSTATMFELPFSVRPEKLVTVADIIAIQRDHYEGTKYDLTQGIQSGPFGNPNRYDMGTGGGLAMEQIQGGMFERAISIMRTTHTSVTQSRAWLPDTVGGVMWWAQYAPAVSVFIPLWPAQTKVPEPLAQGSLYEFDRDYTWWAFAAVGNYAERAYKYILEDIHIRQREWEAKINRQMEIIENHALLKLFQTPEPTDDGRISSQEQTTREFLTEHSTQLVNELTQSWWQLFEQIITKYHDGYRIDDLHSETLKPTKLFYPLWWLKQVGYFPQGVNPDALPVPPPAVTVSVTPKPSLTTAVESPAISFKEHKQHGKKEIPHLSAAASIAPGMFPTTSNVDASSQVATSSGSSFMSTLLVLSIGAAIGFGAGRLQLRAKGNRHEYETIN